MNNTNILKIIIGTAMIYYFISGFFLVLSFIALQIENIAFAGISAIFFQYYLPQILLIAVMILIIFIIMKKGQWTIAEFLQDRTICMTAGLWLLIDGITKSIGFLSNLLPQNFGIAALSFSISNLIRFGFVLCQIASAILLIKFSQSYKNPENDSAIEKNAARKNAIGIMLIYMTVFTITSIADSVLQSVILSQTVDGISFLTTASIMSMLARVAITFCLFLLARKINWNIRIIIQDRMVRITAGSLLIINGAVRLAFDLSWHFSSIGQSIDQLFVIFKIMTVVQIIAGICLTIGFRKKPAITD